MVFTKNLTETEEILFLRIFRFLKYKIAVGKIKTIDDANAFVLSTYFDKIYDLGNWERWEHCEHVREIFTEKNFLNQVIKNLSDRFLCFIESNFF